jgi:Putative Flp pilus-assembly TadE/G-like
MPGAKDIRWCESGGVAVMAAIAVSGIVGVVGVAITMSDVSNQQVHVQGALDAAVLAGTALPFDASSHQRISLAEKIFDQNANIGANMGLEFRDRAFEAGSGVKPVFTVTGSRVSGAASSTAVNGFGAVLGLEPMKVSVLAQAERLESEPVCVLALNEDSPDGLEVYGNAEFNANNCAVQANSDNSAGMRTYGSGRANATQFGVTGNFRGDSFSSTPFTGIEPVKDPYADLPVPPAGACTDVSGKLIHASFTLEPGTYCGGLNIKAGATVTLLPGVYVMKDGQLSVNSGATLIGHEVTIAFVGADSYLHMLSDATATLTSPVSGTYKNIQMMSDRDLSQSKFQQEWTTILSGAKLDYDGVIYLPEQQFWVSGTAHEAVIKGSSPTMIMVADKIWAQGNAVFDLTREDRRSIGADMGLASFSYGSRLVK